MYIMYRRLFAIDKKTVFRWQMHKLTMANAYFLLYSIVIARKEVT